MHFFALRVTVEPKIPGTVIPRRVFTQPGSFATWSCQQQVRPCPLCNESGSKFKAFVTARPLLWVDGAARDVIEAPKLEPWIVRYELSDFEWAAIKPFLPNKSRGVRRVNDRRVLNGIFWVLRSGAPWRDLPICYGPRTTCYTRFVRWRTQLPPLMMRPSK